MIAFFTLLLLSYLAQARYKERYIFTAPTKRESEATSATLFQASLQALAIGKRVGGTTHTATEPDITECIDVRSNMQPQDFPSRSAARGLS